MRAGELDIGSIDACKALKRRSRRKPQNSSKTGGAPEGRHRPEDVTPAWISVAEGKQQI